MPTLRRTHPGLFQVTLIYALLHLGLALDFSLGGVANHSSGAWVGVIESAPLWVWASAQIAVVSLLTAGLYAGVTVLRAGFGLSSVLCWALGASFLNGSLTVPNASFTGVVLFAALGAIAARAFVEPTKIREVRQ